MPSLSDQAHLQNFVSWVKKNPSLILKLLRFFKPILTIKDFTIVSRFDDVQEVLARDDVFDVTYQSKMEKVTGGQNFFLGMRDSAQYSRDVSNMRLAIRRDDLTTKVIPLLDAAIERRMAVLRGKGQCDVVQELTRIIPTELVGAYFGTPGWDQTQFTDAASLLFAYLFYPSDAEQESKALAAAKQTCAYLDQTIAARKAQPVNAEVDDVLQRCLQMQAAQLPGNTDLDIRNNLIGIIIGAIPTTSKVAALVLDYLLDQPKLLAQAQQAAQNNDFAQLNQFVLESMRFQPFGPGLARVANQDYVLGQGHWRATKIPKGRNLFLHLQSAMLDGSKVIEADSFRLDRPAYIYMHYGYGLHTCFGQYINSVQISRILQAVLKLKGLRRAPGEAGQLQIEGEFPAHLRIAYEPV